MNRQLKKVAGFDDFVNPSFIFLLSEVVSQSVLAPKFFLLLVLKLNQPFFFG
jgi:hypothetical protein